MDFSSLMNTKLGSFSLGQVFSALVLFVISVVVIRLLTKLLTRVLNRSKLDARMRKYVTGGVRLFLYIIAGLIVIDSLGIPITSLVALLSVGGLSISLAAEDVLANIAGGLLLLSSHPFNIGDFIEAAGTSGTVADISLNYTKLDTPAGQRILVPNKTLSASQITNYTALGHRRIEQKISASYDAPTETVKAACLRAVSMTPHLSAEPAPFVFLSSYGASAIEYTVLCWCLPADFWDASCALSENLRAAFADAGIEMTYDHLNVHILDK